MTERRQIDLLAHATHSGPDAFETYRYLREEAPVYYDEANALWAVSRYEDVCHVARHPELFTSTEGNLPHMPADASMINQDGRQHTLQRGLVSKGFTPRRMRELADHIRLVTNELIDDLGTRTECEAVSELAARLPLRVIGEMLGLPHADHEHILHLTDIMVAGGSGPDYVTEEVDDAFTEFIDYHEREMALRREARTDDLLSLWLDAEIDGEKLEEDQMIFEHLLLFVGGSESTRSAISGGLLELMRHPEQRQYLIEHRHDEAVMQNAVDEMVRWVTPFIRMCRTIVEPVELHGVTLTPDEKIMMIYPAACRDPRVYDRPDEFDVKRVHPKHHVAFGYGQHFCLGANLARLEVRIFFEELLGRMPDFALPKVSGPNVSQQLHALAPAPADGILRARTATGCVAAA